MIHACCAWSVIFFLCSRNRDKQLSVNAKRSKQELGSQPVRVQAYPKIRTTGFSDKNLLATDPDLQSIRAQPEFDHLLGALAAK